MRISTVQYLSSRERGSVSLSSIPIGPSAERVWNMCIRVQPTTLALPFYLPSPHPRPPFRAALYTSTSARARYMFHSIRAHARVDRSRLLRWSNVGALVPTINHFGTWLCRPKAENHHSPKPRTRLAQLAKCGHMEIMDNSTPLKLPLALRALLCRLSATGKPNLIPFSSSFWIFLMGPRAG